MKMTYTRFTCFLTAFCLLLGLVMGFSGAAQAETVDEVQQASTRLFDDPPTGARPNGTPPGGMGEPPSGGNGGQNGAQGDGTTVTIRDTVITTTGSGSGGIMTIGGGTTYAYDLTVETSIWTLTGDAYISSFTGNAASVVSNGYTLYVNGVALTGTK